MPAAALFQFRLNGGAWEDPGDYLLVESGDSVEARIADLEGVERVEWTQHGKSRTETELAPDDLELTPSGVPPGATVSFTVPTFDGAAWGLTAKVNGGARLVGQVTENATWTAKSKVIIPFENGNKGVFITEAFEEDPLYAVVPKINWLLKYLGDDEDVIDITDALNIGDGVGIRKTKVGNLIYLRSHRGTNGISIVLNADTNTIDVSGANFPTGATGLDGINASISSQTIWVRSSRDETTFAMEADEQNVPGMNNLDIIRLAPTVDNAIWGGMTAPGSDDTHRQLVRNVHSVNRAIVTNEDGGSDADARFRTPMALDFVIEPGASAWIDWDSTLQRRFVSEQAAAATVSLQSTAGVAAMGHFMRVAHGSDFGAEADPNTAPSTEINCVFVPGWNEWLRLGFDSFSAGTDHNDQIFGTTINIAKFSAVEGGHTSAAQGIPPYGGWVDDDVSSLPEFAETPLFTTIVPGDTPRVILTYGRVDSFPDTTQRISYSDDCGTTWVEGSFETESVAGARSLLWTGTNLVAGFPQGIIEFSSDGGETWTVADSPATGSTMNVLLTNGVGTVVFVLANRVYRSTDHGETFVEVEVSGISARAGVFHEGTFYAWTTDNEVWRSADGETWEGPTAINLNVPGWTALRLLDINGRGIVICGSQIVGLFVDDDSANYSREDLFYTRDGVNWTRSGSFGSTAHADGVDIGTIVQPLDEGALASGSPHPARVRVFSTSAQNPAHPGAPWHQLIVVPATGTYGDDPYYGTADCYIGPRDGGGVMVRETETITQVGPSVVYEYYGPDEPASYSGFGGTPAPVANVFNVAWATALGTGYVPWMAITPNPKSGAMPGSVMAAAMNRGGIIRLRPTSDPDVSIECQVHAVGGQPWLDTYTWWLLMDIKSSEWAWDPSVVNDEFTFTVSIAALLGTSVRSFHLSRSTGVDGLVLGGTVLYHLRFGEPWNLRGGFQVVGSIDLSALDNDPRAAVWDEFGVRIYWVGAQNNAVRQLTMSARTHNLSEAVDAGLSMSIATQGTSPVGIGISPDDQHLYVLCASNDTIFQYTFATWGTLTGAGYASLSKEIGTITGETAPTALAVAGRHVYVTGTTTDAIHYLEMSSPPSIGSAALVDSSDSLASLDSALSGLAASTDGSKLYGIGDTNNILIEWNLVELVEGDDYSVEYIPREIRPVRFLNTYEESGYQVQYGILNQAFFPPNGVAFVRVNAIGAAVAGEIADEAADFDAAGSMIVMVQTNNGAITYVSSRHFADLDGAFGQWNASFANSEGFPIAHNDDDTVPNNAVLYASIAGGGQLRVNLTPAPAPDDVSWSAQFEFVHHQVRGRMDA